MPAPSTAKDEEIGGACCLVSLGALGLLVVLPFMIGMAWSNAHSLMDFVDTSSLRGFFQGLWNWLTSGSPMDGVVKMLWVFSVGYCVLFSQWVAFFWQWRTFVSSRRLWVISACFFGAVIVGAGWALWQGDSDWREWLLAMIFISIIPGYFLLITLRLCKWSRTPRG